MNYAFTIVVGASGAVFALCPLPGATLTCAMAHGSAICRGNNAQRPFLRKIAWKGAVKVTMLITLAMCTVMNYLMIVYADGQGSIREQTVRMMAYATMTCVFILFGVPIIAFFVNLYVEIRQQRQKALLAERKHRLSRRFSCAVLSAEVLQFTNPLRVQHLDQKHLPRNVNQKSLHRMSIFSPVVTQTESSWFVNPMSKATPRAAAGSQVLTGVTGRWRQSSITRSDRRRFSVLTRDLTKWMSNSLHAHVRAAGKRAATVPHAVRADAEPLPVNNDQVKWTWTDKTGVPHESTGGSEIQKLIQCGTITMNSRLQAASSTAEVSAVIHDCGDPQDVRRVSLPLHLLGVHCPTDGSSK